MKENLSRVSIPGKLVELLWTDDEFYRDIVASKKASSKLG